MTKLSMCMSRALVFGRKCEVVIGGTLPNFRCACQVLFVSVGCDHNVITGSGETLHGVSIVPIQELVGVHNCTPTRKTQSSIDVEDPRSKCETKLPSGHNAVPPFLSGFPFAKPGSGYDLVALCSARPLTCMCGCSCFRFWPLLNSCATLF